MNRNNALKNDLHEFATLLIELKTSDEAICLLQEIMTEAELDTLSKRWRILRMLKNGKTQREISNTLNVSLCKITRGSKILKNKESIIQKYLRRNNHDNSQ